MQEIAVIGSNIKVEDEVEIYDAEGYHVLPGIIDDQVHFREPGLTHKGTIATESKAAIAGGITSFIEMPNHLSTNYPQLKNGKEKLNLLENVSFANYAFMFGGTNDNLDEILSLGY